MGLLKQNFSYMQLTIIQYNYYTISLYINHIIRLQLVMQFFLKIFLCAFYIHTCAFNLYIDDDPLDELKLGPQTTESIVG